MGDQWAYYDGGVAISPAGAYYVDGNKVWQPGDGGGVGSWMPDTSGANSYSTGALGQGAGADYSGFWGFLGNLGNTYANVWAQTTLQQQALDGQLYVEGQRQKEREAYARQFGINPTDPQGIPPLFLLIGGALLFMMMAKD